MSVTVIGDASLKSHIKSKSADSHAKDVGQERVKSKKRKHRDAISDVLPITTPNDQAASATQDSQSASNPLSPPSTPSAGNVASKHAQLADSTKSDTERTSKKKKNKSHLGDAAHEKSNDRNDESKKEKKEKKMKKKHSNEGKQEGATLDGQVIHLNDIEVQTPEDAASEKSKQMRKRKAEEQSEETPSDSKPRKKKKGHRPLDLPFPDPSVDESLSDQSQKALSYAYVRFQDPPNWKFNKARQIWLIKRLWSEEMIPEKYFALVTKYLADVKGGIRDNLIQMCNSIAASVTADPMTSESATGPTDLSNEGSTITTKMTRARSLLGALSDVQ